MKLLLLLLPAHLFAHTIHYYAGAPLKIIKIGHPTLTMIADEIPYADIKTQSVQNLINDMIKTMKDASGVGLAAPQVNVSKRLFVMKPSYTAPEVVINPVVEYINDAGTKDSREGCLSIPDKYFTVKRYKEINASYYNRNGTYITEKARGFRSIVFQHEYDHLNGILISNFFDQEFVFGDEADLANIPRM